MLPFRILFLTCFCNIEGCSFTTAQSQAYFLVVSFVAVNGMHFGSDEIGVGQDRHMAMHSLYVGLPLAMARKLPLVQNTVVAQRLMGASRYNPITPVLWELQWLLIIFRIQFMVLVFTNKARYGLGPG